MQSREPDNTFKEGLKCINAVMRMHRLKELISRSQMAECDKVILNDCRGHLVDIEIERYCQCKLNKHDLRHTILNDTKKGHADNFNKKIDDLMISLNLWKKVLELKHKRSREAFNATDELLTSVLKKARAAVEGLQRSIPFS